MFDYAKIHPKYGAVFQVAMTAYTNTGSPFTVESLKAELSEDQPMIDIGGGFGDLAGTLKRAASHIHVAVFELPEVVKNGRAKIVEYIHHRSMWLATFSSRCLLPMRIL